MRRSPALVLLLCLGIAAVASILPRREAEAQFLSPGPLSAPHAEIDGDTHCNDCHTGGRKIEDAKCFKCHEDLGKRVAKKKGLHATFDKACGECHVEHIGRNAKLVRWPGGDKKAFDHTPTGWKLEGKHAPLDCEKCHNVKNQRGNATFLGLSSACISCHEDPHLGRFGDKCSTCHGQNDWKTVRLTKIDHNRTRFPLRGKHAGVACEKCHGKPAKWRGIAFASCASCHEDPHKGRFTQPCASCHVETSWKAVGIGRDNHPVLSLANGHAKVACEKCHDQGNDKVPKKGKTCVACHPNVHEAQFGNDCAQCHADIKWFGVPREISLTAHAKTPFPLEGKHDEVGCERCHSPKLKPAQRYRQLVFDRCLACHKDKHKGEFTMRAGGECAACHDVEGFAPATFGVEAHATTRFKLEGKHTAVACARCHGDKRPRLDWRVAKRACAECHANPHGNEFAEEMARGGCAVCHTADSWDAAKIDHSIWPLTGAHVKTACLACHTPSAADRKSGKGASYRGVPRDCEGCHEDVHLGQFRLADPVKSCDACHSTVTYKIPPIDFNHAQTTGYALDGKHAPLACEKCHLQERLADGRPSVRWRLGYRACRDCHADPHSGGRR